MTHQNVDLPLAISATEINLFGCPYCGYRSMSSPISAGGASVCICGECQHNFVALAEGLKVSPIGIGFDNETYYPKLEAHPRRGIPSHGAPDIRPDGGGEFFSSRGIGFDTTPGCFVCGGSTQMRNNIAAFVKCKAAGERVVAMFKRGAYLDYREYEPDYVQVKIGACKTHVPNLERLSIDTLQNERIITEEIVLQAIDSK